MLRSNSIGLLGSVVTIHLEGGQCNSADIQLVTNRGFLPKTIGYVAKDFKFDGEQVLKFKVWDEIESDNTYQLGFIPKFNCGPATAAYSHMFTIINDVEYRHYRFNESQEPDVKYHNDLYYFANEEEL